VREVESNGRKGTYRSRDRVESFLEKIEDCPEGNHFRKVFFKADFSIEPLQQSPYSIS
jgi:hypothetical protein